MTPISTIQARLPEAMDTKQNARSKPDWTAIREAAIAGVPFSQLTERFPVTLAAVKKRSSREKWPIPARIMRRAKELSMSPDVTGDAAVTACAKSLLEDGQAASLHAMRVLLHKLEHAGRNPGNVDDLATVGDVATAVKAARGIAGLDKPEVAVNLNLAGAFWSAPDRGGESEAPVILDCIEG